MHSHIEVRIMSMYCMHSCMDRDSCIEIRNMSTYDFIHSTMHIFHVYRGIMSMYV